VRQGRKIGNTLKTFDSRCDFVKLVSLAGAKQVPTGPCASPSDKNFGWVDTNIQADWGGHDRGSTSGNQPKLSISDTPMCDDNNIGLIAVCWDNRPTGYPVEVPTDVSGTPSRWCAYKDRSVNIATPRDGHSPGQVFECRHL
jgi:hypothetical protein